MIRWIGRYALGLNIAGDGVLINAALVGGMYMNAGFLSLPLLKGYGPLLLAFNLAWVGTAAAQKLYAIYRVTTGLKIFSKVLRFLLFHFLLIETFIALSGLYIEGHPSIWFTYGLMTIGLLTWRIVTQLLIRYGRQFGYNTRSVVIAGAGESGRELQSIFRIFPEYGFRLHGIFDNAQPIGGLIKGRIGEVADYVKEHAIDEIYCSLAYVTDSEARELIDFAENHHVRIKFLPATKQVNRFRKLKMDYYRHVPVLILRSFPLDEWANRLIKRAFDVGFSVLITLLLLSWMVPLIALLIKLDSRGPVFYRQRRSGINNRTFGCWKFRSMHPGLSAEFVQATKDDPRVTRFGHFLRKSNLDELPQIFNVLAGDMSLIGPRPHPVELDGQYREHIDKYHLRLVVRPGITGLSQVKGYRGETRDPHQMRNRVKMDIFYLQNWSLFFDIKIILLTMLNMVKGDPRAY